MIENRASLTAACLEKVWTMLQEIHPEIPPAVLLVYAQQTRRPGPNGGVTLGHFTKRVWRAPGPNKRHEVGVNPYLFHDRKAVLGVLVHEAAHGVLFERDPTGQVHLAGCSKEDPIYHRAEFRDLVEAWGMECRFHNRRYGFCDTGWPHNRVPAIYRHALMVLKQDLPPGVKSDPRQGTETQLFRLVCDCRKSVFARLPVAHAGGIGCAFCGKEYRPARPLPALKPQRNAEKEKDFGD
jgi:hypothetical protein